MMSSDLFLSLHVFIFIENIIYTILRMAETRKRDYTVNEYKQYMLVMLQGRILSYSQGYHTRALNSGDRGA